MGQLRQQLGFDGLIVTDALIMGGVTNYASPEEVAVMAVEAGADILLMPPQPEAAIAAIQQAVQTGRIPEQRIRESAARIWQAKQKLGPPQSPSWQVLAQLSQPAAVKVVTAILESSRQSGGDLPLKPPAEGQNWRNLIVVDDLLNCNFLDRQSPAITIPTQLKLELQLVDCRMLPYLRDRERMTLLQVFLRGNPFRGRAGLSEQERDFYQQLFSTQLVQGLIVYGSPYVLEWFHSQMQADLPWVFSYGQMADSQAISCEFLFGSSPQLVDFVFV
jgi:beta-glucosidase